MTYCRFLLMLSRKQDDGSHRSSRGERSAPRALEAGYREGQDIYPRWQGAAREPFDRWDGANAHKGRNNYDTNQHSPANCLYPNAHEMGDVSGVRL